MRPQRISLNLDGTRVASRLRRVASVLEGPDVGDHVVDGGIPGVIVICHECGGSGLLHDPDELPEHTEPDRGMP